MLHLPKLRFGDLRKQKVLSMTLFPHKKARHEKCDLTELVRKSEENYIDFQSAFWLQPGRANTNALLIPHTDSYHHAVILMLALNYFYHSFRPITFMKSITFFKDGSTSLFCYCCNGVKQAFSMFCFLAYVTRICSDGKFVKANCSGPRSASL